MSSRSSEPLGRVLVAGAAGMVGAAVVRRLRKLEVETVAATRADVDWTDQAAAGAYFRAHRPDTAVLAAAKVGGIHANDTYPADFIAENLAIQNNFIGAAFAQGVTRLIFLGSSCIYPKLASQPIAESELLGGTLEPTNEAYALAKIAGIKMCESYNRQHGTDYRSLMPTNLYGPGDNFHPENSHVIPALLRRIDEARRSAAPEVVIWGTGSPRREFLHVDDLAAAVTHVAQLSRSEFWGHVPERESHVNVGTGIDITIRELAETVARVVGYEGALRFDASKPDGTPRKVLNVDRLSALGFRAGIDFEAGLRDTYRWFTEHQATLRS
ncbi:MAG: GDP-L-fucose synthase [Pseudomonadota bacterium]